MQTKTATAGNHGLRIKNDCSIRLELDDASGIHVQVQSKIGALYGRRIESLCQDVLRHYEIRNASVTIEDTGALDFVLAARLETCIRRLLPTARTYLPEFLPGNRYKSSRERMRFSRLYIPGNSPGMMINAGIYQAHGIILDLEDSVALEKKDEARLLVRNALRQVDFYGAERMVRINQLPMGLDDLEEIVPQNVHVILLPKCESGEEVTKVNMKIQAIQGAQGQAGEIFLMPIVESALGVLRAYEIATAAPNVAAMAIGLEDYCADIGVPRTREGGESQHARNCLVTACKAARIQAIDSVFSDFQDEEGLRRTASYSKSIGFEGIGCIHPNQIRPVHDCFAPTEGEICKAQAIVRAYTQAQAAGQGVVALGSKMIDAPVVKRSRQLIERAIALGQITQDWSASDETGRVG